MTGLTQLSDVPNAFHKILLLFITLHAFFRVYTVPGLRWYTKIQKYGHCRTEMFHYIVCIRISVTLPFLTFKNDSVIATFPIWMGFRTTQGTPVLRCKETSDQVVWYNDSLKHTLVPNPTIERCCNVLRVTAFLCLPAASRLCGYAPALILCVTITYHLSPSIHCLRVYIIY